MTNRKVLKKDHPRIRGEHDRGASAPRAGLRIIPAYAGSTIKGLWDGIKSGDHPRIRGEHMLLPIVTKITGGSSPHTRGAHFVGRPPGEDHMDHPRIRGEHQIHLNSTGDIRGSSPHTRGAHRPARSRGHHKRIIPAYAGSTSAHSRTPGSSSDHPRIRGEHSVPDAPPRAFPGSSPHTRGARADEPCHRRRIGIIPAYAGSTSTPTSLASASADHPRIRGEHAQSNDREFGNAGSSPHTRGARHWPVSVHATCRIIPAYAGSTRP